MPPNLKKPSKGSVRNYNQKLFGKITTQKIRLPQARPNPSSNDSKSPNSNPSLTLKKRENLSFSVIFLY